MRRVQNTGQIGVQITSNRTAQVSVGSKEPQVEYDEYLIKRGDFKEISGILKTNERSEKKVFPPGQEQGQGQEMPN